MGLQISDNTIASEASTYEAMASNDIELLLNVSSNSELSRIFDAYLRDPTTNLNEDEMIQGQWQMIAGLRHLENIYLQYQAGMLSDEAWETRVNLINTQVRSAGFDRIMERNMLDGFSGSFIEYAMSIRETHEQ